MKNFFALMMVTGLLAATVAEAQWVGRPPRPIDPRPGNGSGNGSSPGWDQDREGDRNRGPRRWRSHEHAGFDRFRDPIKLHAARLAQQANLLGTLVKAQIDSDDFWQQHEERRRGRPGRGENLREKNEEITALFAVNRLVKSSEVFADMASERRLMATYFDLPIALDEVREDYSKAFAAVAGMQGRDPREFRVFHELYQQLASVEQTLNTIQTLLPGFQVDPSFIAPSNVSCQAFRFGNFYYVGNLEFSFKPGTKAPNESFSQVIIMASNGAQWVELRKSMVAPIYTQGRFGAVEKWTFPDMNFMGFGGLPLNQVTLRVSTSQGRSEDIVVNCSR